MNDCLLPIKHIRRERKLRKKRERIAKHGKNLAKTYMEVVLNKFKGKQ